MSAGDMVSDEAGLSTDRLVSYSINAEDVMLRRIFAGRRTGFYIDVGAEDPVNGNDFYGLYQIGWRGINIEPNPAYFALLEQKRPEDRNLAVLICNVASAAMPFFIVEDTGLSTCDAEMAALHAERHGGVRRIEIRAATLAQVLDEAAPPAIDVLKIDVEGLEAQVLEGNDWDRFRPTLIMLEATLPQSPIRRETGIADYLHARGYRFAYHDGLNDFFVEAGFVPPPNAFRAPNVFDNVVRWETVALRENYDAAQSSFKDVEDYAKALEGQRAVMDEALAAADRSIAGKDRALLERYRNERRLVAALAATDQVAFGLLENDIERVDMILSGTGVTGAPFEGADPSSTSGEKTGRALVVVADADDAPEPGPDGDAVSVDLRMLRSRLVSLRRERDGLVQAVKDLEFRNRRLASGNAQLQGERLALHKALDQERAQSLIVAEARSALDGLRSLLADEGAARSQKEAVVAARLERANAEADRIERENEAASLQQSAQVEQARSCRVAERYGRVASGQSREAVMIAAMQASTSWKLTRPVRALGRLLRPGIS